MGLNGGYSFLLSLVFALLAINFAAEARRLSLSKKEELEVARKLRMLNKPAVKSFKTQNGDIYDCVDIHKQPAFEHPLLKNHTLQLKPSTYPKRSRNTTSKGSRIKFSLKERCPPGTVVIRRIQKEDLIIAKNYAHYSPLARGDGNTFAEIIFDDHEIYYGAGAIMDIFALTNVSRNQASSAHILLANDMRNSKSINLVQFGWQVCPPAYGDSDPHLYTYWTSDDYQKTGCHNMLCPGYVQVSNVLTPGSTLVPISGVKLQLSIHKDRQSGNWWLVLEDNDHELLGYFPGEIFNDMAHVSTVQMGGVVFSPDNEPSPPMGSGAFPDTPGACEFTKVEFVYPDNQYREPDQSPYHYVDQSKYYGISTHRDEGGDIEYKFQFGGPGGYIAGV